MKRKLYKMYELMMHTINGDIDLPLLITVHLSKDTTAQITKNDFTKNAIMFINLKCILSVDNEINTEEEVKMRLPFSKKDVETLSNLLTVGANYYYFIATKTAINKYTIHHNGNNFGFYKHWTWRMQTMPNMKKFLNTEIDFENVLVEKIEIEATEV